jgi:hypothetical protein
VKILIDNTAIHSGGRALEGNAHSEEDLLNLLELGTALVFSDQILISGFEAPDVAARTLAIRAQLDSLGVPVRAVAIRDYDDADYRSACDAAGQDLREELPVVFNPRGPRAAALAPEGRTTASPVIKNIHHLVVRDDITPTAVHFSDLRVHGACDYILSTNAALRETLSRFRSPRWSVRQTAALVAVMRVYINEALARVESACYAPAIGRSRILATQDDSVMQRVKALVGDGADALRQRPLPYPSIYAHLVRRSRGDPKAIIEEALPLREKARPLRQWLRTLVRKQLGSEKDISDVEVAVRETRQMLLQNLGVSRPPGLIDAFQVSGGISPDGSWKLSLINPRAAIDWIAYRTRRRRVLLLADLARAAVASRVREPVYARLATNAGVPTTRRDGHH